VNYLDRLHETKKNLERPGRPTDKTDNTPHGASFGSFVSTPTGPSQNFNGHRIDPTADTQARRGWLTGAEAIDRDRLSGTGIAPTARQGLGRTKQTPCPIGVAYRPARTRTANPLLCGRRLVARHRRDPTRAGLTEGKLRGSPHNLTGPRAGLTRF
jgi:hypothetical protein